MFPFYKDERLYNILSLFSAIKVNHEKCICFTLSSRENKVIIGKHVFSVLIHPHLIMPSIVLFKLEGLNRDQLWLILLLSDQDK